MTHFLLFPRIDVAYQRPPQTAKRHKGFFNRLKEVFVAAPPVPPAPPVPLALPGPTVSTIPINPEEAAKLRARYTHFRILVIGRANAGKTMLLKRVCNTIEDPIYSKVRYPLGKLLPYSHYPFYRQINPTSEVTQ